MARRVDDFLEQFVLPLVKGGEVRVGRPIDLDELEAFEADLPEAGVAVVAVDEARADVLSGIVVRPPPLVLGADELSLAAAVHNLLFLVHPRAMSVTVSAAAERKVLDSAQRFAARPRSEERRDLLARHALLHNVFNLSRTDVSVQWWTGSAVFRGQRPPRRLTSWKTLRRVHQETSVAGFDALLGTVEAQPVMASLLRRSPLTLLMSDSPHAPAVTWEEAAFVLRDAELARAVAYAAIRPREARAQVAMPARFAHAFEQMLERAADEASVRAVAAFLVHLGALLAQAESGSRDISVGSALLGAVLAPERAGKRPRGLATFFALPNALAAVDPRVAEPPGLRDDPDLSACWDRHRAQVAEAVGDAVIDTLASRLRRHLQSPGAAAAPGGRGEQSGLK